MNINRFMALVVLILMILTLAAQPARAANEANLTNTTLAAAQSDAKGTRVTLTSNTGVVASNTSVPQTVLLIDDDLAIRETTADLLMLVGVTVQMAACGQEAMDFLATRTVDLIVTDLVMPNGDGNWVVTQVRASALHRQTPIIMLSAHATKKHVERGLELGADAYLYKPFDPENLISTVEKFLQTPRAG